MLYHIYSLLYIPSLSFHNDVMNYAFSFLMQKEVLGSQLQLDLYAILGMFRRDVSPETAPAPEKLPTVHPHRDQDERYNI